MSVDIQNSIVPEQRDAEIPSTTRPNRRNADDFAKTYRQLAAVAIDPDTRQEYLMMAEMFDQKPRT